MKKLLAVALVLMSAHAVEAKKRDHHATNSNPKGLKQVELSKVNCDELIGIAQRNNVIETTGRVLVAADGTRCNTIYSIDYDFFEVRGRSVRTRDGRCKVWSCQGVIDGGRS